MSVSQVNSFQDIVAKRFTPENVKKGILVALSAIMVVGMIVSYAIGASWLIPLLFFALALAPLFPLGEKINHQRDRILG